MAPRAKEDPDEMIQMTASSTSILHQEDVRPRQQLSDVATAQNSHSQRSPSPPEKGDLWWIHGHAYDLQDFVERHPGGKEAILLGRGRDCTALVESYHPFSTTQVWNVLEKYSANTELPQQLQGNNNKKSTTKNSRPLQQHKQQDLFYDVLKYRVSQVLKEKGINPIKDRGASFSRSVYYILVLSAWIATGYLHIVMGSITGSFWFAIAGWLMGALGHDAGHFSASRIAVINEWGVWAMSLICNPILWQHQHTYGHHSFTNEFDHDPDLHHFHTLLRVHKKIRHDKTIFQYQSNGLYVLFAFFFVVFGTCFWIPWGMISAGTLYGIVEWQDKDRPSKAIGIRLHMALYVSLIMVAPFFAHESATRAFAAVFLHIATLGVVFAIFSQINHLNEPSLEADMETRKVQLNERDNARLVDSWAAAQVETSNNFAAQSAIWHVLSNGLNLQIEHHLFPGLNHCHLHHIAPTVRQACEEYGVDYKSYDTWSELMTATLSWYDKLSVDETLVVKKEC